jgi:N-acetylglucosaminyl-diphospho-decaprenol L-rhamnosyltransferase
MSTSVLIVNFRGYDDLDRCLDSLEPKLRPGDEVIVVDHESARESLARVAARHPRALCIPRDGNPGFAAGVNDAARHASAPFLCLLNPDTLVEDPLVHLEDWLDTHPASSVVGPRVLNDDGTTQPSARCFPGWSTVFGGRSTWLTRRFPENWLSRQNLLGLRSREALDVDWISGACLMTRREVFERLGGLDESFFLYWEDADYCRRVVAAGAACTYLPQVSIRHSGNGSARFDQAVAIRSFHRSAFHLYWKYAGLLKRLGAPIVRLGLYLRGEFRLRQALGRPAPRLPTESLAAAARTRAEVERSVQSV